MYTLFYGAFEFTGTYEAMHALAMTLTHAWAIIGPSGGIVEACRGIL